MSMDIITIVATIISHENTTCFPSFDIFISIRVKLDSALKLM
jgi:hypothetical protein